MSKKFLQILNLFSVILQYASYIIIHDVQAYSWGPKGKSRNIGLSSPNHYEESREIGY